MDFLLKIVEGPMKGAEIALVGGTTVSFGSGAESDIVVADPGLAPLAAKFAVSDAGVMVHAADGSVSPLEMYTILRFGDTAIAVGPATGKWEKLKEPRAAEEAAPSAAPAPETKPEKKGSRVVWVFFWLAVLAAILFALWFWREPVKSLAARTRDRVAGLYAEPPPPPAKPLPTLAEMAQVYHLTYRDGKLSGNLKRRTERLAIRAMAMAVDPAVKFDLTDDETLFAGAGELLFACSDGQLSVASASNRVVVIKGYAPSAASLSKSLRALNADVKDIEKVDTALVRVGGEPPAVVTAAGDVLDLPVAEKKSTVSPKARPDYPIAGILTTPYPCVVMRNGMRLMEGAQVGTAVLVKIEADRLTLKEGATTFTWEP